MEEENLKKFEEYIDIILDYFMLGKSFKNYIFSVFDKKKFEDEKEMFDFLSKEISKSTKINKDTVIDDFIEINKKIILEGEAKDV